MQDIPGKMPHSCKLLQTLSMKDIQDQEALPLILNLNKGYSIWLSTHILIFRHAHAPSPSHIFFPEDPHSTMFFFHEAHHIFIFHFHFVVTGIVIISTAINDTLMVPL